MTIGGTYNVIILGKTPAADDHERQNCDVQQKSKDDNGTPISDVH